MGEEFRSVKIGIGSDHIGFDFKETIKSFVEELGHEVVDFGCYSREAVDYPDVAFEVAGAVSEKRVERGILICGTGIGVAVAACKYPGIRAALAHDAHRADESAAGERATRRSHVVRHGDVIGCRCRGLGRRRISRLRRLACAVHIAGCCGCDLHAACTLCTP